MNAPSTRAGRAIAPSKPVRVDPDEHVWRLLLAHMRQTQPQICRQWFEEIEPLGITGGVLYLRAHSNVHRDYLQRSCLVPFNDSAQVASGRLIAVRFIGPDDEFNADTGGGHAGNGSASGFNAASASARSALHDSPETPAETLGASFAPSVDHPDRPSSLNGAEPGHTDLADGPAEPPFFAASPGGEVLPIPGSGVYRPEANTERLYDDGLVLNPDYGFDNFIVGPSNRLAHAAALAVAANPGRAYNPYFVHGDVGLGKTHLLQAICLTICAAKPDAVIYYTSCEGFITQFMDAVAANAMSRFRHKFRHVDVLVVDDIHFLSKRDRSQEEFFHTFNSLYQANKQIVLSSDAPPEEIPDLEERLVSRFKWGLVTSVAPPCYETRVAILKAKARVRGMVLPDDAACHIAAKVDSNIRELEGVIVKLQVLSSVERRPLDLAMAAAALGEGSSRLDRQVHIQTIVDAVTAFYNVKVTDLQSKRRQRSIALPRQVCMFFARKHTRFSLEEIGGYFGGRDHTTVMHAVRTVEERIETDAQFARDVAVLDSQVKAAGT